MASYDYWRTESKGHVWAKNDYDDDFDSFGMESGYCNGPRCEACDFSFCEHCNSEVPELCEAVIEGVWHEVKPRPALAAPAQAEREPEAPGGAERSAAV